MRAVSLARISLLSTCALAWTSAAIAVPILRLTTSSGASATITDGEAGDANSAAGVVTFLHPLDSQWFVNVTTGLSKPVLGSTSAPELDLNSVNVSALPGAGWLDVELTDTDFLPTAAARFVAAIGGTTGGGAVSYKTYFDSSNTAFGKATELTSIGGSGLAFSDTASTLLTSATLYSMTLVVRITHSGSSTVQVSSFDAAAKVPEPSSLLLLCAGMLALATVARGRLAARIRG